MIWRAYEDKHRVEDVEKPFGTVIEFNGGIAAPNYATMM
jgi:hypothetical protein